MPDAEGLTRAHRWYFAAVGLFAIWVGFWGYAVPGEVDRAIPWLVPPLHARFLGAMYLSGATLLFGSLRARHRDEVAIALVMAYVWTAMLGIVSFIRLDEFTMRPQVPFWFFAYTVYPAVGLWLSLRHRPGAIARDSPRLPTLARAWMGVQGAVCIALAVALFVAPTAMSARWPWTIPPLLAQIYSGPFLSYGVGSVLVARHPSMRAARLPLAAMVVFAVLVAVASAVHRRLFDAGSVSATLWFGGLVLAIVAMVSIGCTTLWTPAERRATHP